MNDKLFYICPAILGETEAIYKALFTYYQEKACMFRDNFVIYAIRGTFNNLPWSAPDYCRDRNWMNRVYGEDIIPDNIGQTPSMETVFNTIKLFNEHNVQVHLDLSNILLEEQDLYNRYGNFLLRIFQELGSMNQVVVSSPILEDYIFENYPDIPIIKDIADDKTLLSYLRHPNMYDGATLNKRYVPDIKLFDNISSNAVENLDVALNPFIRSKDAVDIMKNNSAKSLFLAEQVPLMTSQSWADEAPFSSNVKTYTERDSDNQAIIDAYQPLGINKFRIESTGNFFNILKENITRFVKEEYQLKIYYEICSRYCKPLIDC